MKRCIIFLLSILFATSVFAAEVNEVTLTVSGTADSEQEATLVALRSAIEQSFGTFVSANTTLLNDEIIKDEIVSVSAGNVKEYEKLGSYVLPNGKISVSLKATVAIQKLINYAKSKGSEAEFSGQTFAMNLKLMELREQNAISAIENMFAQIESMAMEAFDYEIKIGEPVLGYVFSRDVGFWDNIVCFSDTQDKEQLYKIKINVIVKANTVTSLINQLIENTLNSLKLSKSDETNYENGLGNLIAFSLDEEGFEHNLFDKYGRNYLPISYKYHDKLISLLNAFYKTLYESCFNYYLEDLANPNHIVSWTDNPQSDKSYTNYESTYYYNSNNDEPKFLEDNRGFIFAVVGHSKHLVEELDGFGNKYSNVFHNFFLKPSRRWDLEADNGNVKTEKTRYLSDGELHIFSMIYPIDRESLLKFGGFKLIKK